MNRPLATVAPAPPAVAVQYRLFTRSRPTDEKRGVQCTAAISRMQGAARITQPYLCGNECSGECFGSCMMLFLQCRTKGGKHSTERESSAIGRHPPIVPAALDPKQTITLRFAGPVRGRPLEARLASTQHRKVGGRADKEA